MVATKRRRPEETISESSSSSLPKPCLLSSSSFCRTMAIVSASLYSRPTTAFVVSHHHGRVSSSSGWRSERMPPRSTASLWSSISLDGRLVGVPSPPSSWAEQQQQQQQNEEFLLSEKRCSIVESHSTLLQGNWDNDGSVFQTNEPTTTLSDQIPQDNQSVATTTTSLTTTTTATPPSPLRHHQTSSSATNTFQRWKRRLVTREDWKHMHKITGVSFLVASWGLMGYGIQDLFANGWTQPVTSHGRPFLCLLQVLMWSSVFQSFTSFSMACKYRRNQPAVRNTFLCNAAVAILGSVSALWSSPWYPTSLNGFPSMAFYLIMDAIGLIGMGDNLFRLRELIASRQTTSSRKKDILNKTTTTTTTTTKNGSTTTKFWMDVFVYMMPILIGAPFFLAIGWQFGIRHDRTFYLNLIQQHSHRFPHLQAGAVYGMVMVAMGASYSSLFVTLRDKKLIGKRTEGLSLTAIMLCLIGSLYQALRDPGTIAALIGM